MMILFQVKEVVDGVKEIVKVRDTTTEGILLGVCLALCFVVWYMFKHFKGELRRQEDMYRAEIREKEDTIKEIIQSKIKILKENKNDVEQIKQYFIQMAEQIKSVIRTKDAG